MASPVTTIWFLNIPDSEVAAALRGQTSDPGPGRRLLARLFPKATVASLGRFPLNRSASAGDGEIYIGSYPQVTCIQTTEPDALRPSELPERWSQLVDYPTRCVFSFDPESGVSGFSRWDKGKLVRAFSGSADRIVEDLGLPQGFERAYWAGEFPQPHPDPSNTLSLPFEPADLVRRAQLEWLGLDLSPGGEDLDVDAFAVDGRREIRPDTTYPGIHAGPARTRGQEYDADDEDYYDDYERSESERRSARPTDESGEDSEGGGALGMLRRAASRAVSPLRKSSTD